MTQLPLFPDGDMTAMNECREQLVRAMELLCDCVTLIHRDHSPYSGERTTEMNDLLDEIGLFMVSGL